MIVPCGRDQLPIQIDADHLMPGRGKVATHSSGTASRVEDASTAGHHRIDQTRLAGQILPARGHLPESPDVPLRVTRILGDPAEPEILVGGHAGSGTSSVKHNAAMVAGQSFSMNDQVSVSLPADAIQVLPLEAA